MERQVGHLQLELRTVDFLPIYFLAITKDIKAGTIIKFNRGKYSITLVTKKQKEQITKTTQ